MSRSINRRYGLRLSPEARRFAAAPKAPLQDAADVSWLRHCRLGDDQGNASACAIFALASWAEIVHGRPISDADCLAVYQAACDHYGRGDEGLTYAEAFESASAAGWLPGASDLQMVFDLDRLPEQPILAAYAVDDSWDQVNGAGCFPLEEAGDVRGYHAVVIPAKGNLTGMQDGPFVYIENSWRKTWGWNGIGILPQSVHNRLCQELWTIV